MDSQSTQTIKLPILQPCEYDLWKIRMEQERHLKEAGRVERQVSTVYDALPNEHQLKLQLITRDAYRALLMHAMRTDLRCTEVIEQTYERLQKLISQLEMHGEVIPQEHQIRSFLRSFHMNGISHILYREQTEIETLSLG
ncbi:hypothetical protein Tco_0507743 [Tanacetum coccineum]